MTKPRFRFLSDINDFKSGATFILNPNVETELISTQGKAYGTEFLVKKLNGDLNGWISYTYSRVLLRSTLENGGELINNGEEFPSAYDKPHSVNFLTNYQFTKRFNVSLNLTYSTGRPITLPIAKYNYGNSQRVLYSDRNEFRIPNYFRMDLSMNLDGNHNLKKVTHNFWTFGVYNLTGRNNPYSLYFNSENGRLNGYKLSIFGRMVPFINFNIKF